MSLKCSRTGLRTQDVAISCVRRPAVPCTRVVSLPRPLSRFFNSCSGVLVVAIIPQMLDKVFSHASQEAVIGGYTHSGGPLFTKCLQAEHCESPKCPAPEDVTEAEGKDHPNSQFSSLLSSSLHVREATVRQTDTLESEKQRKKVEVAP